jgi:hypothetical protein
LYHPINISPTPEHLREITVNNFSLSIVAPRRFCNTTANSQNNQICGEFVAMFNKLLRYRLAYDTIIENLLIFIARV